MIEAEKSTLPLLTLCSPLQMNVHERGQALPAYNSSIIRNEGCQVTAYEYYVWDLSPEFPIQVYFPYVNILRLQIDDQGRRFV